MSLIERDPCRLDLATRLLEALTKLYPEAAKEFNVDSLATYLEKPPDPNMGDYAFPCFRFAKPLKKKPDVIANELSQTLQKGEWLKEAKTLGAFLNFYIVQSKLAKNLVPRLVDGSYFKVLANDPNHKKEKVMVEFSQPNTHKVFHVGHMRNVSLGDSICRLYAYCGYPVVRANYIGDEGAHIAKCLWYIEKNKKTAPVENRGEWLGDQYTAATFALEQASPEDKKKFEAEISELLKKLEAREPKLHAFWKETKGWSMDSFYEIYDWLDVKFDHYFYESDYTEASHKIVKEYFDKGVFIESQGCIGIDLEKEKMGFLMIRKSDGSILYATRDLALAKEKFTKFQIDHSIYVVASEQNLHFKQVFKTLEKMGFDKAKNCHHLSYGMVVLPEGKMSSRAGNVITFSALRETLGRELREHMKGYEGEWPKEELDEAIHRLSVGAIKFGMLCSDAAKDIVFEMKDWLSFEGNTGPYLMYSYARTLSIVRKAEGQGYKASNSNLELLLAKEESELLRFLYDFNDTVEKARVNFKPSLLAHHLFDMSKAFNRFYTQLPVIKAETAELRDARLALIQAFADTLKVGLSLLGMTPPERM